MYLVKTADYWKGSEETHEFDTEEEMLTFINENKAYVTSLEKVEYTDMLNQYIPEASTLSRYMVGVNEMFDDADYCSCVNDQYPVYVYAKSSKEAKEKGLELVKAKYGNDHYYYEVATVKLKPLEK